jgi:hypothetical protein
VINKLASRTSFAYREEHKPAATGVMARSACIGGEDQFALFGSGPCSTKPKSDLVTVVCREQVREVAIRVPLDVRRIITDEQEVALAPEVGHDIEDGLKQHYGARVGTLQVHATISGRSEMKIWMKGRAALDHFIVVH